MSASPHRRTIALLAALAVLCGLMPAVGAPAGAVGAPLAPRAAVAKTEAAKLDAIPTPKLSWYGCYQTAQCTTVSVPLDYDQPKGAKVTLALLKIKARKPSKKIGTLFLNPGGPGGSATTFAYYSSEILSDALLDRFDVVGMDPRGIGFSTQVTCLAGARAQAPIIAAYSGTAFPTTAKQEQAWLAANRIEGTGCSKDALATSMSTAEVARDMELMRRAVGDSKLSYLGFSYGTYLGQVYANMFPDRFRAVVADGVLDPVSWAGNTANQGQPLEQRLNSGGGAWKALRELLRRCDKVGGQLCAFAPGDPVANLALISNRLKKKPIRQVDPDTGEVFTFGYADLVAYMLAMLYSAEGTDYVISLLSDLLVITEPGAGRSAPGQSAYQKAKQDFLDLRSRYREQAVRPSRGFPYDNTLDASASVTCTDSAETTKGASYAAYADQAERRAPYFGRIWTWSSAVCAGDTFTGQDEDAYRGPFTTRTAKPVLFVGDYYDPATNYAEAVSAAKRMPNSRLLSSNSWGHTAYGTSSCVTGAVERYLVKGTLPAKGKVCTGDLQPFDSDDADGLAVGAQSVRWRQPLSTPFR